MEQEALQDKAPEVISKCWGCGRNNENGLQIKSYWTGEEAVCTWKPQKYHLAFPGILNGGIIAAFTLVAILPDLGAQVNFGTQGGPSDLINQSVSSGLFLEMIFTFFLVLVIFMTAVHKKAAAGWAGFSIGGMIFLLHLVGVPLTGASMNPARTLGPAIASGFW
ncbi:hypothetical protein LCGC14_3070560, partial [marine sediment metagenome]